MDIPPLPAIPETSDATNYATKTFAFTIKGVELAPTYWQAGLIVFLLFLIVLSLARMRHLYMHWSLKSFLPAMAFGFILAFAIELLLFLNGTSVVTGILGWENAPKPISTALDVGRQELKQVLGDETYADEVSSYEAIMRTYSVLPEDEKDQIKDFICK